MGVRILNDATDEMAVLYDSVTDVTFGPLIREYDSETRDEQCPASWVAEAFLKWLGDGPRDDPRRMLPADVVTEYNNFLGEILRDGWEAVTEAAVA
jgi:hypothetical protein